MDNNNALKFKRNSLNQIFPNFETAKSKLAVIEGEDGEIILGRYYTGDGGKVETAIGIYHDNGSRYGVTVIGTSQKIDVNEIIEEVKEQIESELKKPVESSTIKVIDHIDGEYELGVKISNKSGNTITTDGNNGIYAKMLESGDNSLDIREDGKIYLKVNSGDSGILYTDGNGINIDLDLNYDAAKSELYLVDKNGNRCSSKVDTKRFEADNVLKSVTLVDAEKNPFYNPTTQKTENKGIWLRFEWSTAVMDANPTYICISDIIKEPIEPIVYDGVSGITIDEESHGISIRLGDNTDTTKFLYLDNMKYSDGIGLFFNPRSLELYLSELFLSTSGGTVSGDIEFNEGDGIDLAGAKVSNGDDGFSVTEDGVKKFGYDDGGFYTNNDGEKEYIDDTYLRKDDYKDGANTFVFENDQALEPDEHITLLTTNGYCVVSVITTIGKLVEEGDDESKLVADKVVEDIVWLDRNYTDTYCSRNEGVYACVSNSNYAKLCYQDGLDIMKVECKVLQGECSLVGEIETGWTKNVYPEVGMMHSVVNETTDTYPDNYTFPLYEIFSTTSACIVNLVMNVGSTTITDTIHVQNENSEKRYLMVYSEDNYGCFKWKKDGEKIRVYICKFNNNQYPKSVYYRTLFEKERGCVTESFKMTDEGKNEFYAPVLRSCDLEKNPIVHVRGGNEFLDAMYLLTNGVYNPYGRIILEDSMQINWMCTHTIGDKTYYTEVDETGKPFVTTDAYERSLIFPRNIGYITIECASENVKIFNISGLYTSDDSGKIAQEAAFVTTIKANNLIFENVNFGRQSKSEVVAYTNEGLEPGEYTVKTDGEGRTCYVIKDAGEKIAKVTNSTVVDQKRSMFEIDGHFTMRNCKVGIQGLMDEVNGEYINQTEYTFNNPLVKIFGDGTESCGVKLENCEFTCPFENKEDLCVDDSIKIASAIDDENVKSCNIIIDGCNVISNKHIMSNDSVVKLSVAYILTGNTKEDSEYVLSEITDDCVYNVHRDSMRLKNDVEDVTLNVLPENESIVSKNGSITVTRDNLNGETNIEVYEPSGYVQYVNNLTTFLNAMKDINNKGGVGSIKVVDSIDMTPLMTGTTTSYDTYGINTYSGYVDFNTKLNGITIEGVTPQAAIITAGFKTTDSNIISKPGTLTSFHTNGMIMGEKITMKNITIGKKVSGNVFDNYNKSGDFRMSIFPLFKVRFSLNLDNCIICSQNNCNGEIITQEDDRDKFTTFVSFEGVYGSGSNSTGMTLDVKDCEFSFIANYAGDATTSVQDEISITTDTTNKANLRRITGHFKFTNCRILQPNFAHDAKAKIYIKNIDVQRKPLYISTYKGNLDSVFIDGGTYIQGTDYNHLDMK